MKKRDYIITVKNDKTGNSIVKPVIRRTKKGISDYANKMFRKYDLNCNEKSCIQITVNVGYFNKDLNWVDVMEYHA